MLMTLSYWCNQGSSFPPMAWGGSFFELPPQGPPHGGEVKNFPPRVSPMGGKLSPKNFAPAAGSRKNQCNSAPMKQPAAGENFGGFVLVFPSENAFCKGKSSLAGAEISKFSQLPPHGGGEVSSTSPPGSPPWEGKLPPQGLPHGGEVFLQNLLPPHPWGGSWIPGLSPLYPSKLGWGKVNSPSIMEGEKIDSPLYPSKSGRVENDVSPSTP